MLNLYFSNSLVKMVYGRALRAQPGGHITYRELEKPIRRNFSGLDDLDPVKIFSEQFPVLKDCVKVILRDMYNPPTQRLDAPFRA